MNNSTKQKKDDKKFSYFQGAMLNKKQTGQTVAGFIFSLFGMIVATSIFEKDQRLLSLIVIIAFTGVGFFGFGLLGKEKK